MGRKKGKHVLMSPVDTDWPKLDKDTEDQIMTALMQKLQEFPSLETKRMKDARRKAGLPSTLECPKLTPEEEETLKARLRQQLVIGHRQVCKFLEQDQLTLVLASGDAQPPILLRSLLPLVASRGCPGACLSSLMTPSMLEAMGVSSIMAIGFRKIPPGEPNDFQEFVALATKLAPPLSVSWFGRQAGHNSGGGAGDSAAMEGTSQVGGAAAEKLSPAIDWPLMDPTEEKGVMEKLIQLFKPYAPVFKKSKSQFTPADWEKRRVIKACIMMDLAALRDAAKNDSLDLLLVQLDRCAARPILTSAVKTAIEKGCPVLHMASLKNGICVILRDFHLKAVGFKKMQDSPVKQPIEFRQFIAMASQFVPSHPCAEPTAKDKPKESTSGEEKQTETSTEETTKKPASPAYDTSNLYVYKTDKDKEGSETGTQIEASSTSEAYISLLSEPTVQMLGVKPVNDSASTPDTTFVDTAGCGVSGKELVLEKTQEARGKTPSTESTSSIAFMGVMGLDTTDAPTAAQPFYPEPGANKPKAGLKRELDRSVEQGEFMPFRFSPTNIRMSVPDPEKKHKKMLKKS